MTRWLTGSLVLSLFGCSSGDDGATPNPSDPLAGYDAKYCVGTLLEPVKAFLDSGQDVVPTDAAPTGTRFLLTGVGSWSDGQFFEGNQLVLIWPAEVVWQKGAAFSTDCPDAPSPEAARVVFHHAVELNDSPSMNGKACTIPAGTTFTNAGAFKYAGGTCEHPDLASLCGFSKGYSAGFTFGLYVLK